MVAFRVERRAIFGPAIGTMLRKLKKAENDPSLEAYIRREYLTISDNDGIVESNLFV